MEGDTKKIKMHKLLNLTKKLVVKRQRADAHKTRKMQSRHSIECATSFIERVKIIPIKWVAARAAFELSVSFLSSIIKHLKCDDGFGGADETMRALYGGCGCDSSRQTRRQRRRRRPDIRTYFIKTAPGNARHRRMKVAAI